MITTQEFEHSEQSDLGEFAKNAAAQFPHHYQTWDTKPNPEEAWKGALERLRV